MDNVFLGRVFGIIFTVAILFMPIGTMTFTFLLSPKNIFNFVIVGLSIGGISLLFYRIFSKRLLSKVTIYILVRATITHIR